MADSKDAELTVNATDFKARCLELLTRLDRGAVKRVTVTKRGRRIAVVERAHAHEKPYKNAYGFMRGRVRLSPDYDPFEQVIEQPADPFIGRTNSRVRRGARRRPANRNRT